MGFVDNSVLSFLLFNWFSKSNDEFPIASCESSSSDFVILVNEVSVDVIRVAADVTPADDAPLINI